MPGEDNHASPSRDRPIHMFETVRLDKPACFEDADFLKVRVFGYDTAEIIPHASDDPPDLGRGKLGKGQAEVASRKFGNAEKWANAARQSAPAGGSGIERQKPKHAEQERRSPGL
jgi:hypothetical protein